MSADLELGVAAPDRRARRALGAVARDGWAATVAPVGNALAFQRSPLQFVSRLAQRGDVVPLKFLVWNALFVNEPGALRHVLLDNHKNYTKQAPLYRSASNLIGQGLITSDGELWRHQRHQVQPIFKRRHVASLGPIVVDATVAMFERWDEVARTGEAIDMSEEIASLTLHIVGRALFGADISDRASIFGRAFTEANGILAEFARVPFPPLGWPTPRGLRLRTALRTMDAIVYEMIEERRARRDSGGTDLLSLLVAQEATESAMSSQQLRDEVMTLLLAGHETSANTLTWASYLLGRDKDVDARLHAEIESVLGPATIAQERLAELPYTTSVIEETMRLYPPVWFLMRCAANDDIIDGREVRAGTLIFFSPYTLHHHPRLWPDPERFDPERFAPSRAAELDRWAHIPFSAGPRACVGSGLAMMQMQIILAAVVQRYRLQLTTTVPPVPQPLLTLRPSGGLWMRLHRRVA